MQSTAPSDDQLAARLRGFGPLGLLAILVILLADVVVKPLSAVLVVVWASRSHTPWREIGYVRPRTWIGSLTIGVLFPGGRVKVLHSWPCQIPPADARGRMMFTRSRRAWQPVP